jgi:hypothetical protein
MRFSPIVFTKKLILMVPRSRRTIFLIEFLFDLPIYVKFKYFRVDGKIVSSETEPTQINYCVGPENVECHSAYTEHMNIFYVRLNVRNPVSYSTDSITRSAEALKNKL